MLPYSLEGSKVSGQKIAEVFEKLNPLRAILAGKGIKINFFLCGTSILAPSLAQDIDITIHTQTMSGETLAPKLFETTFLSLAKDLESIGFGYLQLILDRRCTHIVSMLSADETIIKVDLTCYNTDVEEALNNGLTNISAVYLGINGDMHATREIAEFYKEQTDSPTPKILMRTTSEPTDSAYEHVKKVKTKADHMGWNTTEIEAWLSRHSARPTLTASPPKSHESNAVSTPKTSPIVTAFRAALEAKRAAAALAVSATSSP